MLSRHSVGIIRETSSHTSHQGMLINSCLSLLSHCGPVLGLKSGICALVLTSTIKKKKKHRWGMICGTFTLNYRLQTKATTTSRLRSMTLSQLAFHAERDLNFAQGTSQTGSLHLLTKNVFNVGVLFGDIYRINLHTWFTESRGR